MKEPRKKLKNCLRGWPISEETKININAENLRKIKKLLEVFNLDLEYFVNKLLEKELKHINYQCSDAIDFFKSMK